VTINVCVVKILLYTVFQSFCKPLMQGRFPTMIPLNQGRNEGASGAQFPGRRITAGAPTSPNNVTITFLNTVHLLPKDLAFEHGAPNWGHRQVTTMSHVLFSIQYICFRKTSGSNIGAPNLIVSCPGRYLTTLRQALRFCIQNVSRSCLND